MPPCHPDATAAARAPSLITHPLKWPRCRVDTGFWYIYRRGETTPAYSHIGLDTSATLNNQKHASAAMKQCIEEAAVIGAEMAAAAPSATSKGGGVFGSMKRLFSKG